MSLLSNVLKLWQTGIVMAWGLGWQLAIIKTYQQVPSTGGTWD
ncbi:hypothetical protein CZ794_11705 [Psychrobacter sp. JB385]|nr:hypothetical protein CZ794_11705 [Psychrobacter sp. JB385]